MGRCGCKGNRSVKFPRAVVLKLWFRGRWSIQTHSSATQQSIISSFRPNSVSVSVTLWLELNPIMPDP